MELDLNQAHIEEIPKRKGTKVFRSLERGLDKVITVLTRSKRRGSAKDWPRRLKVSGLGFFAMDFRSWLLTGPLFFFFLFLKKSTE